MSGRESVDHTETTISRSTCKCGEGEWGSTMQTATASNGQNCIRAGWPVKYQPRLFVCSSMKVSLSPLGVEQVPVLGILLLPHSAYCLHSFKDFHCLPSSPLCACILSFSLLCIPLLPSTPSIPFEGAVTARQPSNEETSKQGQREGN